jgi:hypothetical protein
MFKILLLTLNKNSMSTLEFNDALINLENYLKAFAMGYTKNLEDAEDLNTGNNVKSNYLSKHVHTSN